MQFTLKQLREFIDGKYGWGHGEWQTRTIIAEILNYLIEQDAAAERERRGEDG